MVLERNRVDDRQRHERGTLSFFLTGLAAGAAWQLLYPRYLASRLTFIAVLVIIGVIVNLAARREFVWEDMDTVGLLAIGILLGLIYTEHYQRWRDRTARKQPVGPAQHHNVDMS